MDATSVETENQFADSRMDTYEQHSVCWNWKAIWAFANEQYEQHCVCSNWRSNSRMDTLRNNRLCVFKLLFSLRIRELTHALRDKLQRTVCVHKINEINTQLNNQHYEQHIRVFELTSSLRIRELTHALLQRTVVCAHKINEINTQLNHRKVLAQVPSKIASESIVASYLHFLNAIRRNGSD
jgi:hypothetical protein